MTQNEEHVITLSDSSQPFYLIVLFLCDTLCLLYQQDLIVLGYGQKSVCFRLPDWLKYRPLSMRFFFIELKKIKH